ncbi:phage GP46 family protein [Ephemeroptericola cinctiostellae]|uniref:phage GP46 family protein n=1 Tax=Ephemeroptericola cinctiostellae TaxID=2268024 RepID=UPI00130023A3|nr:phage GP46 family protein [Ephemeroptericola cinctiostellae]
MIDIATIATNPATTSLSMPFDWALMADASAVDMPWIDAGNLCAGLISRMQQMPKTYAFALECGLHTAVIHSLYTDARAGRDDGLPYNSTDKRGWLGAEFIPRTVGNGRGEYGSRLWLNYYKPARNSGHKKSALEAQRFAAQEALAWLIDDGVIDSMIINADYRHKDGVELLAIGIVMYRDNDNMPIYDAVWGSTIAHEEGYYAST